MLSAVLRRYPLAGLLSCQLLMLIIVALVLYAKQAAWGRALLSGGLAFWLPNALFMLLILLYHASASADHSSRQQSKKTPAIAWLLLLSEAVKMVFSMALLVLALAKLHMAVIPLIAGWLLVLVTQILVPMMINRF